MRLTVTILAVAFGISLFAFAPRVLSRSPEPGAPAVPSRSPARPAALVSPGEKSIIGTLEKYDPATRQLTLNLGKSSLAFRVTTDATVRQGSRRLKAEELATHRGVRVKLRYSESAGQRRADWIVLAPPPRPARTH